MSRALFLLLLMSAPVLAEQVVAHFPAANVISLLGQPINDREGHEIGRIVDILASRDGQTRAAVADIGGFIGIGARRIAISWKLLRFQRNGDTWVIGVDASGEEVAAAPAFPGGAEGIPVLTTAP